MSTHAQTERFHSLDATRAVALLLGVVIHAAGTLCPKPVHTSFVDCSTSEGFEWLCFFIHQFRMPVFMLIAGLFGRMLYHRQGPWGFARNRFQRIVIPLLVSWPLLAPIITISWWLGNCVTGVTLTSPPVADFLRGLFLEGRLFLPRSLGGSFNLYHLWFLYYLALIYACFLPLRPLLLTVLERPFGLSHKLDHLVALAVKHWWSALWLAPPIALFLVWDGRPKGIATPGRSLVPALVPLVVYGQFFCFGWLLHRQTRLVADLERNCVWRFAIGMVLTLGIHHFTGILSEVMESEKRPALTESQIADWPGFLTRMKSAHDSPHVEPGLLSLWHCFSDEEQKAILRMPESPDVNRRLGLCSVLDGVLRSGKLTSTSPESATVPPPGDSGTGSGKPRQSLAESRRQFDVLFEKYLAEPVVRPAWYRAFEITLCSVCAVSMWLLVLGFLGLFQRYFHQHSPTWRYIADSSYWMYLAHMAIIPPLQVLICQEPWPALLKFLLLNVITLVLLTISYHYCVRSTFIGESLNGKRFPRTPLFPRERPTGSVTTPSNPA